MVHDKTECLCICKQLNCEDGDEQWLQEENRNTKNLYNRD
jgi:hypothetical protein